MLNSWLGRVDAELVGPRRWRSDVLDELRDGLLEAIEVGCEAGQAPVDAARMAVAQFGDPRTVGVELAVEGAAVLARRVAGGLLTSGPQAGAAWVVALTVTASAPWCGELIGLWRAMPVVGPVVAVVIAAAVLALRTSSRPGHRRVLPKWSSVAFAQAAALGCVGVDLTMLILLGTWAVGRAAEPGWALAGAAVAFSMGRLFVAARAAIACNTVRITLAAQ